MKRLRILIFAVCLMLAFSLLTACGGNGENTDENSSSEATETEETESESSEETQPAGSETSDTEADSRPSSLSEYGENIVDYDSVS